MLLTATQCLWKKEFTQLIAEGDDQFDNQIRVTNDGYIYLSRGIVGAENLDGIAFRLESFDAGNDYVGIEASKDEEHVTLMYRAIKDNWKSDQRRTYIDDWAIRKY